jgi:hypothetical protein
MPCEYLTDLLVAFTLEGEDRTPKAFRMSLCKLAISALVVASLFGATAIASAKAPGAGSKMATHHRTHKMMSSHKNYRYSRAQMDRSRPGGEPISRKPAGE